MAIAVEMEDFEKALSLSQELSSFDFSTLSPEDARKVSSTITAFIEKAKRKELEIVKILDKKQQAKRFLE